MPKASEDVIDQRAAEMVIVVFSSKKGAVS